eukprot:TRINITY_DN12192_c0_g1_i3.p1 TRINITY_DN12192_c0_g1~~TRINITY_DN12192_c0_g1_i3.p1  ORF type:complete len:310 (+),score=53.40 TRINITY_DN12192_c0_g1_i3:262-1191(+)
MPPKRGRPCKDHTFPEAILALDKEAFKAHLEHEAYDERKLRMLRKERRRYKNRGYQAKSAVKLAAAGSTKTKLKTKRAHKRAVAKRAVAKQHSVRTASPTALKASSPGPAAGLTPHFSRQASYKAIERELRSIQANDENAGYSGQQNMKQAADSARSSAAGLEQQANSPLLLPSESVVEPAFLDGVNGGTTAVLNKTSLKGHRPPPLKLDIPNAATDTDLFSHVQSGLPTPLSGTTTPVVNAASSGLPLMPVMPTSGNRRAPAPGVLCPPNVVLGSGALPQQYIPQLVAAQRARTLWNAMRCRLLRWSQ